MPVTTALRLPAAALALTMALPPASAQTTPEPPRWLADYADLTGDLNAYFAQIGLLVGRFFVDMTWDRVHSPAGSGDVVASGLTIYPEFPWDPDFECVITADAVTLAPTTALDSGGALIEVSGITLPGACFEPSVRVMLLTFGYDTFEIDRLSLDYHFDLPSSALDLAISAEVSDALDASLEIIFDYVWFRFPDDGFDSEESAEPIAVLDSAELVLENRGLWQQLMPLAQQNFGGDLSALPDIASAQLTATLADPATGALDPAAQIFVDSVSHELARFLADQDRIALSATPEHLVWLHDGLFDDPRELVSALEPVAADIPQSVQAIIPPQTLALALSGTVPPDRDTAVRVGTALLDGVGAPLAPEAAAAVLGPIAGAGDAEASALLAHALERLGNSSEAYEATLAAMAGGQTGLSPLADRLESALELTQVLALQDAEADIGDLPADPAALRRLAEAAADGRGRSRSYAQAYLLAGLAAAGGDRGAAKLRDRIDLRMTALSADDPTLWRTRATEVSSEVYRIWTTGLGDAIADRYGLEQ